MQSLDRIQRREDGALLPGRNVGGVLAGQNDSAVDLTEVVVMGFSRFIRPVARAAKREWDAVPGDRDAVLELFEILGVNLGAVLDRALHSLGWRKRRELIGIRSVERVP